MLSVLTVRDIVLIEQAALEFAAGLNVLTGETGAGKSILLDALGLACGGRSGGRSSVRVGAERGSVTAQFDPPVKHPARVLLEAQDMPCDDSLLLRRTVSADGRTRAFINDGVVSVQLMNQVGDTLIEVHGQNDDRGLFDPVNHRILLDNFGGHGDLLDKVRSAFAAMAAARGALVSLKKDQAEAAAEADDVHAAIDELSLLDVQPGEENALAEERAILMNATHLAEDVSGANELLSGDAGAESQLSAALRKISRMSDAARSGLAAVEAALESACVAAEDARRELEAFLSRLEADPAELDAKEERLFAIRAAARKYNVESDALPAVLDKYLARSELIDAGDEQVLAAQKVLQKAQEAYLSVAAKLTAARKKSAKKLETSVAAELKPLKLGHARFRVSLAQAESGTAEGMERVSFEIATVAGADFGPLARIASGGELARFSLAIKVALAEESPLTSLVFDEVDRGVGGAVADAVGERLQRLAKKTQVLLVTHSPQVAARADRHFRISRQKDQTKITMLDDAARLEEVARMLSGAEITDEARAAAARLIAEARR